MTIDTVAAHPAPLSRVWSGDKVIAEDVQGEDLADVLQLNADASAWWVMSRSPDEAGRELRRAANALELDDLAIRDLLAVDHRAKYEELGQSRLVMTNAVSVDTDSAELTICPVSLVVTDRALICLVDAAKTVFDPARLLQQKTAQLADGGVEHALQLVLAAVINTYDATVNWLEDESDDLSSALFEQRPLSSDQQLRAFRVRTVLSQLRRVTDPMRAVMEDLVDGQPKNDASARRWSMIREHHERVANAADSLREVLGSVFDTSLALADLRMNDVMKKLTGWAGIIAVPTLVTGFAGMNVSFPFDGTSEGFWLYLVLMVAAVAVLYLMFRRKHWV